LKVLNERNILIIDDDQDYLNLLALYLKDVPNLNIHTATDADTGFKMILYFKPDILILDIKLEKSDGIKLGSAIDIIHEKGIPTIFISGDEKYKDQIDARKFIKPHVFYKKPFSKEVIVSKVVEYLIYEPSEYEKDPKVQYVKPLPIRVVSTIQLLDPLIKILILKISTGFSFLTVIDNISKINGIKSIFDFWLLFPLAGLALLSVRKWSYFAFLALQGYAVFSFLTYEKYSAPYFSEVPLISTQLIMLFNILIIIYFLFPQVRRPFFDRRIRGWENELRYPVEIPCELQSKTNKDVETCEILNISKSGAFIITPSKLEDGESLELNFSFYSFDFKLVGTVMTESVYNRAQGYGIQFNFIQYGDKQNMRKLIKALSTLNSV
jgi:CheY-like chemotaxis protein